MEDKMPLVGLCGEPKEALEKIEYMMQALSLQGQFSEEEPVRTEKAVRQSLYGSRKICGSVGSSGLSDLVGQL